jgi:predicted RND superfamily exporter protein
MRRRAVVGGTFLATLLILAGFVLGPSRPARDLFELPGDPTFEANRRVQAHLPAKDHIVFMFVAGRDPEHRGNVLNIEVLRELLERRKRMLADKALVPFFKLEDNAWVGHPTRGPWGLPETIRESMDGLTSRAPWFGPGFESATQADLDLLLTFLFNYRLSLDNDQATYPFRDYCSPDLILDSEGHWRATGLLMPVPASRGLLEEAVEAGRLANVEEFEHHVDRYYQLPFPEATGEAVQVWSFAAMNRQIDEQVKAALPLVGIAFLIMNLSVALFFRNWRDLVVTFLSLALLIGWVKGFQAWLGYPDTQLSALLPVLILALGVDFSIHSLQRWRLLARDHPRWAHEPREAELEAAGGTIRSFLPALGLATLTTGIAFGTALFSPIPDLKEWGLLAVLAILSAYWLLGVFAVYLRSALSPGPAGFHGAVGEGLHRRLGFLPGFYRRHGVALLTVFGLITVAMLIVGRPEADFDARDYLDHDTRFIRGFEMEKLTFPEAGEPGYLLIEGEQLATPQVMARMRDLVDSLPEAGVATTSGQPELGLLDLLDIQASLLEEAPRAGTPIEDLDGDGIPDSTGNLTAVLEDIRVRGTRDRADPHAAHRLVSPERAAELFEMEEGRLTRTRIWINVPDPDHWPRMGQTRRALKQASSALENPPGVSVSITGPSFVRYAYVNALTRSFTRSTWIAIGLCALVLIVALRDVRLGLLTVVPVLVVAVWLQAIMVFTGMSLNIVTVQVISLAIGLGIDYSIHVTQRMREARREQPEGNSLLWMFRTMKETGLALFASAGTTLVGFLILLLSPMPLFTMFGTIMAIMIGLSLVSGLLLLPALLLVFGGFRDAGVVAGMRHPLREVP